MSHQCLASEHFLALTLNQHFASCQKNIQIRIKELEREKDIPGFEKEDS
jgi:hypothetical protein